MKILAIDPGTFESAYLFYDVLNNHLIEFGKVSNEELILVLSRCAASVDYLVIEGIISYGMPVGKETLNTKFLIGRLYQLGLSSCIHEDNIHIISRKHVLTHHCFSAKASDSNLRQALIDRLGKPGTKKVPGFTYGIVADVWSALGIATFLADKKQNKEEIFDVIKDKNVY